MIILALLWAGSSILALQPRVVPRTVPTRAEVIYYSPSEYLPPLDTRVERVPSPAPADPERSPQTIISVPPEPDNRAQTIVAPPKVRLSLDVPLPNVVAWSDHPELPIGPAPVVQASEITRLTPRVNSAVVAPPPEARTDEHRLLNAPEASVVAPPPVVETTSHAILQSSQPAVIAPPPTVSSSFAPRAGNVNVARSVVIAPAPQLAVNPQHEISGASAAAMRELTTHVVAPPPALSAAASNDGGGRMIALNLRPAISAPPDPPSGNRRGTFAAGSEGHAGASGTAGNSAAPNSTSPTNSGGSNKVAGDLPSGLYVGKPATQPASPVTGQPAPTNQVNPNLLASARPPRISSSAPHALEPENESRLSEPEREVFRNRRFYSLTLNMPNLNSAGGSWVIRFAELKQNAAAGELSAPLAVRKVDPAYPLELMRQNVGGMVILYGVIRADGTVANVRVLRSVDDRIDQFASEAIAKWHFDPAMKNGVAVDVEATFQIPFRPGRARSNF